MTLRRLGLVAPLLGLAACAGDIEGIEPPPNSLYFPVSVTMSPDYRYAYISNSNFDLRYNAGWIEVLDLDAALDAIAGGDDNPTSALVSRVKVLSLSGEVSLDEAGEVAIVASRGDGAITILEVSGDGSTLDCGDANATAGLNRVEENTDCDEQHLVRLSADLFAGQDLTESEVTDPFASVQFTWRPDGEAERWMAAVGHVAATSGGGRVSLFEVDKSETVPELVPVRSVSLVNVSPLSSLAVHPEMAGTAVVGTSQRYTSDSPGSTLYSVDVTSALDGDDEDNVLAVSLGDVGGDELFDIAFSVSDGSEPDGQRAYVSNQTPDTLVVLDTSLTTVEVEREYGNVELVERPRFRVLSAVSIPDEPTGVAYLPRASGHLVAVASLDGDAVQLHSPQGDGLRLVERFEDVGLGPFGMAYASRRGRDLLLVTTFFDHGLAIFDLTSAEPVGFLRLAHIRSDATLPVETR